MTTAGSIHFCRSAAEAPSLPGAYVLQIEVPRPTQVRIGRHPPVTLAAGRYLYCGSANGPGGLRARLARHFRRSKTRRWHVDQLTTRGRVIGSWIVPDGDECALVNLLRPLPAPVPGFGSSDCVSCPSHLLSWPDDVTLPAQMFGPCLHRRG